MAFSFDLGTLLLVVAVALLIFLAIDLAVAGGCATGSMMGDVAGMMTTPWGWSGLLVLMVGLVLALLWGK